MVVLVGLRRHEGLDKVDVALDSFIYYLLSHDRVEYNVEFDDNFFQMIRFVGLLLSHKESVFFFQNVLNLADNV